MSFFDVHKVDLRLPRTRRNDEITDRAVTAVTRALGMRHLLDYRKDAINAPQGVRPNGIRTATYQIHTTTVHKLDEPKTVLKMERNTERDGMKWTVTFTIHGIDLSTGRQVGRLTQAIKNWAGDQDHLEDLIVNHGVNYVEIVTFAYIGETVEPTVPVS